MLQSKMVPFLLLRYNMDALSAFRLAMRDEFSDWSFRYFPCFLLGAFLHGGGGPQIGEVTCGWSPHPSCKRDQNKKRDFMDRWVTPPKRVNPPTWAPPPPCKQALNRTTVANAILLLSRMKSS